MRQIIAFWAVLALFACGCATAKGGSKADKNAADDAKIVVTTGMADIRSAGDAEAYDRAMEDAKRKAVEEVIGTFVDSQTVTENGSLLQDKVFGRSAGYLSRIEPLKKWKEDGLVYQQVRFTVKIGQLKDDVLALDLAQQRMNMPRVIFYIYESANGKNDTGTSGTVYNELVKKFQEKRFVIVNRQASGLDAEENALVSGMDDSQKASGLAVKIGAKNNAEIVVTGKATAVDNGAIVLNGTTMDMHSYQANVKLQVINVADGRILAIATKEGAAGHINAENGCVQAFKKITPPAADELIAKTVETWEDILNNGNLLTLDVQGLTLTDSFKFQKALQQYFREVKEVFPKKTENGVSQFMVRYLGNARDFAMALSTVVFGYKVDVLAIDSTTLKIKAAP